MTHELLFWQKSRSSTVAVLCTDLVVAEEVVVPCSLSVCSLRPLDAGLSSDTPGGVPFEVEGRVGGHAEVVILPGVGVSGLGDLGQEHC